MKIILSLLFLFSIGWGQSVGALYDVGKCEPYFQKKLTLFDNALVYDAVFIKPEGDFVFKGYIQGQSYQYRNTSSGLFLSSLTNFLPSEMVIPLDEISLSGVKYLACVTTMENIYFLSKTSNLLVAQKCPLIVRPNGDTLVFGPEKKYQEITFVPEKQLTPFQMLLIGVSILIVLYLGFRIFMKYLSYKQKNQ